MLSNALKFSKPHDVIEVRLKLRYTGAKDEVELLIEVADKGIGISEDEQLKIFQTDFRTQNPLSQSHNRYGHGLGLSICQRIMEQLKGKITVSSKLGAGAIFTVTLKTTRS